MAIANFRLRPAAVTTLLCDKILEASCHTGESYNEVLVNLAKHGLWVSHDTYHRYHLAYERVASAPRHFNHSAYRRRVDAAIAKRSVYLLAVNT